MKTRIYIEEFEIKPEHLTLLKNAYVYWNDCEYGAPSIDCKRPYGNSDVIGDVAEILGLDVNTVDEKCLDQLHQETLETLQICLQLQKFETGIYRKINNDNWIKL
jgi:hypothetical protein